jgi:MscS family membrane protein
LLVGTLALIGAWLLLQLLSRHGRNMGSHLAGALRRPVLIGLGVSLYASWIIHQLNEDLGLGLLVQAEVNRISTMLVIASITWAVMNVGQTVLMSASMRRWIQIKDQQDESMLINVMSRLYTISVLVIATAALMVNFGVPSGAIATMLGGAGIGFSFATQQISQNFLSGFMLFFNRPFREGDWINSIQNPGEMYNRRILANIGLRYEDLHKIGDVTKEVRTYLEKHPDIDQSQSILVNFNEWDASSINMMIYCFTKTTVWKDWLDIQQSIFLDIAGIVQRSGADFAFNCTTLYPAPDSDSDTLIKSLNRGNPAS